ncbi:hypothetical protein [Methylobacterium sp. 17Sr1-1]|uniref:hypothetical protein n=1 Tax=Methylobacterium sp. 17Sr1-1 TaxID=2202826 RepID=UPI000D70333B|nr:hypothetical protein [Methylobacterium sp. 17Sr1-1]AWN55045.1 hypothetical protein DK412_28335 [Methylobacterium sp. 17Sr1-1]
MTKAKKPKVPPKRVLRVAEICKGGQRLHCQFRPRAIGETDDVRLWWFEPSGENCGPASAREAIALGLIVPADDGLFGTGDAQTYIAAQS